jgi:NAD(P)-dependent dehydrogenase (short-subunit alcohol dehydrogenase family)
MGTLRSLLRSWLEIMGFGIRINVLSPGVVDAPSLRTALSGASGADQVDALSSRRWATEPLGRLAEPCEMARPRRFSPAMRQVFITGVEFFAADGMALTG